MLKSPNVATPATADAVVVPASVPPRGLVRGGGVRGPVRGVAVLPGASRAVPSRAGVNRAPAVVDVGPTVKTSRVGAPGVTAKPVLVARNAPALACSV